MKTVGIIGFGHFGRFLADKLDSVCAVRVYARDGQAGKWGAELEQVAQSDYVILAVPLTAYEAMLERIKTYIPETSVIVDICSVKVRPIEIITSILPRQRIVSTHPLFGPQSAANSLKDHTVVVCPEQSNEEAAKSVIALCRQLDLKVVEMSAEAHDQEMATVHGLTFFIAHSLKEMGLQDQTLATPSFHKLLDLAILERQHTEGLFTTIQAGNPYAKVIRDKFTREVESLGKRIDAVFPGGEDDDLLAAPRKRIDEIDSQIVHLLAERTEVVKDVAAIKQAHDMPVEQNDRFRHMMDRLTTEATELGVDPELIYAIWDRIHESSKSQQTASIER